jgi:gliding motility-associated lipoprotein GldH
MPSLKYSNVFFVPVIAFSFFIVSCRQIDVFEKNTAIPHYNWDYKYKAAGSFTISDTLSAYNIYIVLRHTDAYKYNNIWLNVGLQPPGDTMHFKKIEVILASEAGGWDGTGMNDIWEVRKLISQTRETSNKIKAGQYKFSISQVMRDNPLPNIISAGLRIEKAQSLSELNNFNR